MRLLLFSNSKNEGEEYLAYTQPYISSFLDTSHKKALFMPYAGITIGYDSYFEMVRKQLHTIPIELDSIHEIGNKQKAIETADIIIIGGGNTFQLLKSLQDEKLITYIKQAVNNGAFYIGWSAGSNLACPGIHTTNDMPVVQPHSFHGLGLIPFQINPHYTDFRQPGHAGESRDMRLEEYIHVHRNMYVVGLREGTLLRLTNGKLELLGNKPCRIFRYGQTPFEVNPGENLDFLMQ